MNIKEGEKMRHGKHHEEVNEQGIGQCSVPMWREGMPAGFCDNNAYSKQTEKDRELRKLTDQYLYVPALACPIHGGEASRVFKDGNSWCAVKSDFVDLQESPAGFGDTPEEARGNLEVDVLKHADNILKKGISELKNINEKRAYKLFPSGCKCTETNNGGDCDWCQVYYNK